MDTIGTSRKVPTAASDAAKGDSPSDVECDLSGPPEPSLVFDDDWLTPGSASVPAGSRIAVPSALLTPEPPAVHPGAVPVTSTVAAVLEGFVTVLPSAKRLQRPAEAQSRIAWRTTSTRDLPEFRSVGKDVDCKKWMGIMIKGAS